MINGGIKLDNKKFVASAFKTFDLKLGTLAERIAFQKTIYLMQEAFNSGTTFQFIWHNFGPYCSELATMGQFLNDAEISLAQPLACNSSTQFKELKIGKEGDSRFLEMVADIVFLKKNNGVSGEEAMFNELVRHRSYLDDKDLFRLAIDRLKTFNLF